LAAIHGAGLVDCAVVVTRWFGGTKLGVGGLVRAYGDAAARALEAAPRHLGVAALRLRVRYPFEYTSPVMRALEWTAASGVEHGFDAESGMPESCFAIRASLLGDLESWLLNQTAGGVAPMVLGECVLHEAPGTAS
jgi:putative IMPACT (imprinted ancient) family translation regulator